LKKNDDWYVFVAPLYQAILTMNFFIGSIQLIALIMYLPFIGKAATFFCGMANLFQKRTE